MHPNPGNLPSHGSHLPSIPSSAFNPTRLQVRALVTEPHRCVTAHRDHSPRLARVEKRKPLLSAPRTQNPPARKAVAAGAHPHPLPRLRGRAQKPTPCPGRQGPVPAICAAHVLPRPCAPLSLSAPNPDSSPPAPQIPSHSQKGRKPKKHPLLL